MNVARIERSEIRVGSPRISRLALNPGYAHGMTRMQPGLCMDWRRPIV